MPPKPPSEKEYEDRKKKFAEAAAVYIVMRHKDFD
jgi:hypothetical protein